MKVDGHSCHREISDSGPPEVLVDELFGRPACYALRECWYADGQSYCRKAKGPMGLSLLEGAFHAVEDRKDKECTICC